MTGPAQGLLSIETCSRNKGLLWGSVGMLQDTDIQMPSRAEEGCSGNNSLLYSGLAGNVQCLSPKPSAQFQEALGIQSEPTLGPGGPGKPAGPSSPLIPW